LSSWNCPLFLSLAPLVGVVAAGNHAIIKPSELAPATGNLITSMLSDLFPAEYVCVITGGPEIADELTHLPLDHLVFTGSTRVGKLAMKAASENLVPVTLELGGKSPVLVHPSFPIREVAKRVLTGKLYNAGQTCVAPDYILIHADRCEEFVNEAKAVVGKMYSALVDNADYTRIINSNHYHRIDGLVEDARGRGAQRIQINPAGESCDAANRVFPPTLLVNVSDDMAVMQEEIFGPVLPIVQYRDIDEAVAYINSRAHPLAFYYFDNDQRRAADIVSQVRAGGVTVNDCIYHAGQAALPFGGVGPSGMGRYHGFDGFATFSNKKSVFFRRKWSPLSLLRPPYTNRTRQFLRFLLDK
jgi:coniferyl-aldehyde dehydrogenase